MTLKKVDWRETRVPGGAIPAEQRRQGTLGKLDGMGFRAFQTLPLIERGGLLTMARVEKAGPEARFLLTECDAHQKKIDAHNGLGRRHIENKTITGWAHSMSQYDDPDHYFFTYISEPTFNWKSKELWEKSHLLIRRLKKLNEAPECALQVETMKKIGSMIEALKTAVPALIMPRND